MTKGDKNETKGDKNATTRFLLNDKRGQKAPIKEKTILSSVHILRGPEKPVGRT
jgi:hypothetical protein